MEEGTRKQKVVPWSMEFTVPGQFLDLLKQNLHRVKALFKVEVKFSSKFEREDVVMQWISLVGGNAGADDMNNAKSYIIAITNPEVCISVENFPTSVFEACRDQVERDTVAFLQHKNNAVIIKGSELAVVLAQSMLESFQGDETINDGTKKDSTQNNDSRGEPSHISPNTTRSKSTVSSDTTPLKLMMPISSPNTSISSSTSLKSRTPTIDKELTYVKSVVQKSNENVGNLSSIKMKGKEKENSDTKSASSFASTFKSSEVTMNFDFLSDIKDDSVDAGGVDLQYDYLKSIGLTHRFDVDVIDEGLNRFDMTDVVKPVEFLDALRNIQLTKDKNGDGALKWNSDTNHFPSNPSASTSKAVDDSGSTNLKWLSKESRSNTSVILIDSDADEDDDDDDDSRGNGGSAIVISSDEEKGVSGSLLSKEKWHVNKKKKQLAKKKNKTEQATTARSFPTVIPSTTTFPLPTRSFPQVIPSATASPLPSTSGRQRKLRYIVIDGCNVAMAHGESRVFSVPGIQICIDYFLKRGHKVTAFVPESRRYSNNHIPIKGKPLLEKLNKDGTLKFTPARRLPTGKTITSYDDRFILNLADVEEGIVVSNDYYRDLLDAKPSYRNIIESRLLPFTFVGDHFMPPDDPLGRNGPTLDDFLSHGGHSTTTNYIPMPTTTGKRPFQTGQPNFFTAVGQGPPPHKRARFASMGASPFRPAAVIAAQEVKRRAMQSFQKGRKRKKKGKRYFPPTQQ